MIERFEIVDKNSARPDAERILFCDGTGGSLFHAETDLELSHWRPNCTPAEYRAGTSTEICFRFLDHPRPGAWTVAVNNHVDIDGILSVYVLLESQYALAHRRSIIEAAEMGDFWGWGELPAQRVFQVITRLMESGLDGKAVYAEAFRRIPALLAGTDAEVPDIDKSLAPLRQSVDLVEQGRIVRTLVSSRLAHYVVPLAIIAQVGTANEVSRATYVPEFNELVSERALLWPQARALWDAQRASLISIEQPDGWLHELWFPGYHWADTEGLWRVPGMTYHDGMQSYTLANSQLIAAFEQLQRDEPRPGTWALGGTSLPLGKELQKSFPLVGRFADPQGQPATSGHRPETVAKSLAKAFE